VSRHRRLRMSQKHYDELVESRDWCAKNGYVGFKAWYDDELAFQAWRRALPEGVQLVHDAEQDRD
jgi:hypothetical protein